jgi:hypothetical protein
MVDKVRDDPRTDHSVRSRCASARRSRRSTSAAARRGCPGPLVAATLRLVGASSRLPWRRRRPPFGSPHPGRARVVGVLGNLLLIRGGVRRGALASAVRRAACRGIRCRAWAPARRPHRGQLASVALLVLDRPSCADAAGCRPCCCLSRPRRRTAARARRRLRSATGCRGGLPGGCPGRCPAPRPALQRRSSEDARAPPRPSGHDSGPRSLQWQPGDPVLQPQHGARHLDDVMAALHRPVIWASVPVGQLVGAFTQPRRPGPRPRLAHLRACRPGRRRRRPRWPGRRRAPAPRPADLAVRLTHRLRCARTAFRLGGLCVRPAHAPRAASTESSTAAVRCCTALRWAAACGGPGSLGRAASAWLQRRLDGVGILALRAWVAPADPPRSATRCRSRAGDPPWTLPLTESQACAPGRSSFLLCHPLRSPRHTCRAIAVLLV